MRTGEQYIQGLRRNRNVWLDGERVDDVTAHPAFQGGIDTIARLYDLQHTAPECSAVDPTSGERVNVSHIIPRSAEDLRKRGKGLRRIAEYSAGVLGRSPDYLNITMAGFAGRPDVWSNGNEEGCANLIAYQQALAKNDWALTHTLIHPTVDKGLGDLAAGNGDIALHKVEDTANGILVRGARVLATLAPFSDEIVVYPGGILPREAKRHALIFSIPVTTPGLKFVCRDSYSVRGSRADHPFSSRFDEQDAFVIFDNVEIPRDRVFLDGNPLLYNKVMQGGWTANIMQQTAIRCHVKLTFAHELACRMADAINASDPGTKEMLGELWTYAELARSTLVAAEAGASEWGSGTWFCDEKPFRALRPWAPKWFPRVKEILTLIGSHNLLAAPVEAAFANPELEDHLGTYLQGARGLPAQERVRLFRAAWDFCGSALGGRNDLYERFYSSSASRSFQIAQASAQSELASSTSLVDKLLSE